MLTRICLGLALLAAMPAWSQVEPSATGPPPSSDEAMQAPPSVSGEAYPAETGSEARSNYLRAGVSLNTSYDDKVLASSSGQPAGDITYSVGPSISLDQSTPRTHRTLAYNPGFTFYQHDSALNSLNQNAAAGFQYLMSPHSRISLEDSFSQTSNSFQGPNGGISGSTQPPTGVVVAPYAQQLRNTWSGEASYQFSRNGMFGGSGIYTLLNYPNPAQAAGLPSSSNSLGGAGFYNLRLSSKQYVGVTYQYTHMSATLTGSPSVTQIHTINSFYTLHLKGGFLLSLSGGPQHFSESQFPFPASGAWTPGISASTSWQLSRINVAGSYTRTVSGAGGLAGAFHLESGSADVTWQFARSWSANASANYSTQRNVLPSLLSGTPGGHTISGTASVQHPINDHLSAGFGYSRIQQSYGGIAVISANPDSDRVYGSISYQLAKPLGK